MVEDEPQYHVLRCGGCRRAFRVPQSIEGAEFMCSRCLSEGRRRYSDVEAEEREARFARMRAEAHKPIEVQRMNSTFFVISEIRSAPPSRAQAVGRRISSLVSSLQRTLSFKSRVSARERNLAACVIGRTDPSSTSASASAGQPSRECKVCFEDYACIVCLPCGHGGLCEGCAKDMVTMTKECYLCRKPIDLIAKLNPESAPKSTQSMGPIAGLENSRSAPAEAGVLSSSSESRDDSAVQQVATHSDAPVGHAQVVVGNVPGVGGALGAGTTHALSGASPARSVTSTFVLSPPFFEKALNANAEMRMLGRCAATLVAPEALHHINSREFHESELRDSNDSPSGAVANGDCLPMGVQAASTTDGSIDLPPPSVLQILESV